MLENVLDEFINYLAVVRNYSPRTLPTYRSILENFFKEASVRIPTDITPDRIEKYFAKRITAGKSVNSNSNIMVAIRAFLLFGNKRDYTNAHLELFEVPRRKKVKTEYLTPEELNAMINVTPRERDRLILLVMFTSGCRVSELVQISVESFKDNQFTCMIKGNKPHVYYFDPTVADRLRVYIQLENIAAGRLFRNTMDRPIEPPAISHIVRKAARIAKVSHNVSPHQFRHGWATATLENGADVRTVQEMLGHEQIQTTMRYLHITDKRMQESHEKFAPKVQLYNFGETPQFQYTKQK